MKNNAGTGNKTINMQSRRTLRWISATIPVAAVMIALAATCKVVLGSSPLVATPDPAIVRLLEAPTVTPEIAPAPSIAAEADKAPPTTAEAQPLSEKDPGAA